MNDTEAQRLLDRGREVLRERMEASLVEAGAAEAELESLLPSALEHADEAQWRHALALCAAGQLDIGIARALRHPLVSRALELSGAVVAAASEGPVLELSVEHVRGVANLARSERVTLRLSAHELLLTRREGELVGQLAWDELHEVQSDRRRIGIRRHTVLSVRTRDGEALFAASEISPQELSAQLMRIREARSA